MPVQRFAPMTKDFATFDCDAHVTEPPLIWERAAEYLTREEMQALRSTIWWDEESRQLIVNGRAGVGIGSPRRGGIPGTMRVISNAGPGVKHDIQRALNVRNLKAGTALTQEQVGYIDFAGSYEPEPRLRDMDVQGIDQVMIIPTDIDTYPWLLDAVGAKAFCKAYNQWAYEYTKADPDRLFFAALLPMQNAQFAVQEVHRVAAQGCRVALVRPTDAMGNYPLQPKYEPVWNALEETGMVYGMHPFPAGGALKPPGYTEQYSGAELIRRTISASGIPHSFLTNVQNFQSEASLWVTTALMTGLFERHPKLKAAVFEASSTWLSFLLDECDKAYRLYRNERKLPPLKRLPSETFFEHCMTGFEGDEAPPPRFPEFYSDILIWSSDVYHHDGDDAWRAMETMQKFDLPVADQAKFLGGNARRLYRIDPPKKIIRDRVTQIERPNWWPTEEEVKAALAADASVTRLVTTLSADWPRTMTTISRHVAVFDSDSHVVEPPELWEKYLDPEFRVLGKQALWRHDGETNSYLKINGEVVRDTMNSNLPRHAIWRPGMSWDVGRGTRCERASPDERGCMEPTDRGWPTWMRWASIRRSCTRPGLPRDFTWSPIRTPRMRWHAPTMTGSPISAVPTLADSMRPQCCRCRTWTTRSRNCAASPASPASAAHSSVRCSSRTITSPARISIRCGRSWNILAWSPRCIRRPVCGIRNGHRTGSSSKR